MLRIMQETKEGNKQYVTSRWLEEVLFKEDVPDR